MILVPAVPVYAGFNIPKGKEERWTVKVLQELVRKTGMSLHGLAGAFLRPPERDNDCRRCCLVNDVGFFLVKGGPEEHEQATEVLLCILMNEKECRLTRSNALYFLSREDARTDDDMKERLRAFRDDPKNADVVEKADLWLEVA